MEIRCIDFKRKSHIVGVRRLDPVIYLYLDLIDYFELLGITPKTLPQVVFGAVRELDLQARPVYRQLGYTEWS